jgi:hypothetical protein
MNVRFALALGGRAFPTPASGRQTRDLPVFTRPDLTEGDLIHLRAPACAQLGLGCPEGEPTELRRRINAARWPEGETVSEDSHGVWIAAAGSTAGPGSR